ncbi:MAG: MBL fold metallo-hydrolase [Neisseriaceae bacterium]
MKYFFKSDVLVSPYIMNWYAWPQLIPPITLAANIVKKYIKIMEKYIEDPIGEQKKANDPELLGGPYIDLSPERIVDIISLLSETKKSNLIQLYLSIQQCDEIMQRCAKGDSMSTLYSKVPDCLKGMVELVYDRNGNPHIRLFEELFYNKWYEPNLQSLVFAEIKQDFRTYSLRNTPLVDKLDQIKLCIPFAHAALDKLFSSRYNGLTKNEFNQLCTELNIEPCIIEKYFTKDSFINSDKNYIGDNLRVRYFGHACILLQSKNISILIDPIISYDFNSQNKRYTLSDLPDQIDYVLLTHKHMDHFSIETLIQIRHKVKHIVVPRNLQGDLIDPSMKLILKKLGFNSILSLDEFDSINFAENSIHAIPFIGEHSDLNLTSKLSYIVKINNKKIFFAVDIENVEPAIYRNIFENYGKIDLLFIGMECEGAPCSWLYGPLLGTSLKNEHNKRRTLKGCNAKQALEMVKIVQCNEAYVYAMGLEPWLSHIMGISYNEDTPQILESNLFIEECKKQSIKAERLNFIKEWVL